MILADENIDDQITEALPTNARRPFHGGLCGPAASCVENGARTLSIFDLYSFYGVDNISITDGTVPLGFGPGGEPRPTAARAVAVPLRQRLGAHFQLQDEILRYRKYERNTFAQMLWATQISIKSKKYVNLDD